jgi:hypothetical protein
MKRLALAILGVVGCASSASASVVLERFPPAGPIPADADGYGGVVHFDPLRGRRGQTVTVQNSGRLLRAEILVSSSARPGIDEPVDYEFLLFAGANAPLLARAATPGNADAALSWQGVDLGAADLFVNAGDKLLISVNSTREVNSGWLWFGFTSTNPDRLYAGGEPVFYNPCGVGIPGPCDQWVPDFGVDGPYDLSYRLTIDTSFAAIPEPSIWAMMLLGFGSAGLVVRRRSARQQPI